MGRFIFGLLMFILGYVCQTVLHSFVDSSRESLFFSAGSADCVSAAVLVRPMERRDHHHSVDTNDPPREEQPPGWKRISVFYGNTSLLRPDADGPWPAQARQDRVVATLFRNRRGGVFVDLAANDAYRISNTYGLERHLDWDGLCIEANPWYWRRLALRRCTVVAAVVGGKRMEHVTFTRGGGVMGGIVGHDFDNTDSVNDRKKKTKGMSFFTVTLAEIFARHDTPTVMDYLSLDVEGAEGYILESFPFDRYTFRVLTIERPKPDLCALLYREGYELLRLISYWGETLWVHKDHKDALDIESVIQEKLITKPLVWHGREACREAGARALAGGAKP